MTHSRATGFKLQLRDGLVLNGCLWQHDSPRAIILFMHGIESHLGWFMEAGDALNDLGFAVYGIDRRGSGHSEGAPGHMHSFRDVLGDMKELVSHVRSTEGDEATLIGLGLSLGSNFWSAFSILNPRAIDSIVMVGPGIKPRVTVSLMRRLWILGHAILSPKTLFPIPIRDDMFTANPAFESFLRADRLRRSSVTARFFLELLRMQRFLWSNAKRLELPLHVILAGADSIIDNDGVIRWVRRTNSNAPAIVVFDGAFHSLQFELPKGELAEEISLGVGPWLTSLDGLKNELTISRKTAEYIRE